MSRISCPLSFCPAATASWAARRDRDSTRAAAPLKPAQDAVLLDSSNLTFEQVLAALSRLVEGKMNVCQ